MTITSRPATEAYRHGWDRAFAPTLFGLDIRKALDEVITKAKEETRRDLLEYDREFRRGA